MPITLNGSGTVTGISAGGLPDGVITRPDMGYAGAILQVVNGTYGTATTITSTSFTDTGLSVSITPSSATSKVFVCVFQPSRVYATIGTAQSRFALLRGSTVLTETGLAVQEVGDGGTPTIVGTVSFMWLDSPSTTSAVTYKTQALVNVGTNSETVQTNVKSDQATTSSIIVAEVAG
jgi:hypothetical protein